jgi:glycosyltransferase involved in cell wall biosynthesis
MLYLGGSRWWAVLFGYARRLWVLLRLRQFDVVIIEKELFPFLPAAMERLLGMLGVPYVVDYDDALFHRYDRHSSGLVRRILGGKIDKIMRHSALVVVGNEYLAERARQAGAPRVEVVPTVVDTVRYRPRQEPANDVLVVGWMGTPKTSQYLLPLLPVFESLQTEMCVRFVAVGASEVDFEGTPVEIRAWSEETEVDSIQQFDIGIMPLEDSPWERGKCGYKLIQYMACGLPVVASPVGVNCEIVLSGENGLLADTQDEWKRALDQLLRADVVLRQGMGRIGRSRVENWYSLQVQAPRLFQAIKEVTVC